MPALTGRPRRGVTLLELIVALVAGGVVAGAAAAVLAMQQRSYAALAARTLARRATDDALATLPVDLRSASAAAGDLTAISPDSLQLRATLGGGVACAVAGPLALELPALTGDGAPAGALAAWGTPPRPGDTLMVLAAAPPPDSALRWTAHAVEALQVGAGYCTAAGSLSGGAGVRYRVTLGASTPLPPTAGPGAAFRLLRHARYKLYRASDGRWYLGYTDYRAGGGWAVVQPVSGPYAAPSIDTTAVPSFFRYYDAAGAAVGEAERSRVARVRVTARPARAADSTVVDSADVALRGA